MVTFRFFLIKLFYCLICGLSGFIPYSSLAQYSTRPSETSSSFLESSLILSTIDRTPFWLHANQFGTVLTSGSSVSLRGGINQLWTLDRQGTTTRLVRDSVYNPSPGKWTFELGAEAVANVGATHNLLLPQAYGTVSYGNWRLLLGRRKQWIGLADSTLGMGSYAWSTNALPIPQIQFGLHQYTKVPFTQGWLSIKGFVSEGWFEKNRSITKELKFHQKQLYGRLGKPGGKFFLLGGLNHQAQWGGKTPYETVDGQMPKRFSDYLYVISGVASRGRLDSTASFFDNSHRIGNHLGTVDFGFEVRGTKSTWTAYRQNIYEDGSLFNLENIKDGLNGIKIQFNEPKPSLFNVREAVFEVLYTKNQAGRIFIFNQAIFGKDNYFNHAQVRDGWSYHDRGIGTPFIPPTSQTVWKFPNYGNAFTSNNRVWVLHTGLRGSLLNRYEWSTKLSYSSNAGVYDLPFPETVFQFSGVLTLQTPLKWLGGSTLKGSLATDVGGLYPNSTGLMLSLRKELFTLR
jgi:hypothetical protein